MNTTLTKRPAAPPREPAVLRPEMPREAVNVGEAERWLSVAGGSALALYGLSRGTLGGLGLAALGGACIQRGWTGHCAAYEALGHRSASLPQGQHASLAAGAGIKVERTITINRPAAQLYRLWRDLENLPLFMRHLKAVQTQDERRSHWIARGP